MAGVTDEEAMRAASPHTLAANRLPALARSVHLIDDNEIPGDIVECGVWMGGQIIAARLLSPARRCWLYDTFSGMTEPSRADIKKDGYPALAKFIDKKNKGEPWCKAELHEVHAALAGAGVLHPDLCRFVVGDVLKTLREPSNLPDQIALLRLDTDWYASTKLELEVLYPRLSVGGVLFVDDYGHWQGSRKAVDEYFGIAATTFERVDKSAVMMVKP